MAGHRLKRALLTGSVLAGLIPSGLPLAQPAPSQASITAAAPDASAGLRELDCLLDASLRVKVSAAVPGLLAKTHVDRGDLVREGQLIAELDSEVERAAVLLAKAKAENLTQVASTEARANFLRRKAERFEHLARLNAGATTAAALDEAKTEAEVAQQNYNEARKAVELAQIELQRAEKQLRQRYIHSPVNGIVIDRALATGEYRHEQAHIFNIARVDPLHVEVFAPLDFYPHIHTGGRAIVRPEAPVGGAYPAQVSVVDRTIDAASGTFGVRLLLANTGLTIPAGLRCRVTFLPGP